jgi:hypothetical protein
MDMAYELSVKSTGDYLHVKITGTLNHEIALDVWRCIVRASDEYLCYKILWEQFMENPLTTIDAFNQKDSVVEAGITFNHKIAWVDLNPTTYRMTHFTETVLVNRGLVNTRLFKSVDEARNWLFAR